MTSYLARNAKKILLATKPAPVLRSSFAGEFHPARQLLYNGDSGCGAADMNFGGGAAGLAQSGHRTHLPSLSNLQTLQTLQGLDARFHKTSLRHLLLLFLDRPTFQLGSMSHLLGRQLPGYKDLPEWPLVPPDPTTRHAGLPSAAPGVSASSDKSLSISQLETETESTTETEEEEDIEDDDENGSRRVAAGQVSETGLLVAISHRFFNSDVLPRFPV